jgi:CBS domain-containing protein
MSGRGLPWVSEEHDDEGGRTVGIFGTIATFGVGYAAGAVTGRRGLERLPARAQRFIPGMGDASGEGSLIDLREIREVMTAAPDAVRETNTLQEAARLMRSNDIGDVLVEDEEGRLAGIITDRDIAVRAVAEGTYPARTIAGLDSRDITALAPTDTVHDAITLMRAGDVRRLPVVESGKAIGIVSLGDISVETAPGSVLADISSASPDR